MVPIVAYDDGIWDDGYWDGGEILLGLTSPRLVPIYFASVPLPKITGSMIFPNYSAERSLDMVEITTLHLGLGIVRGDSFTLTRTIPNVPSGDTIASAKLTLKGSISDADPGLFQLTGTVTSNGATGIGLVSFAFSSANTLLMVQDTPYYFDIQLTMTLGNILTIEQGVTSATYQVTTT